MADAASSIYALIERAQAGDAEAISAIYEQCHLNVFRYLYYRTGDSQAADDLTSEVFYRMIRALASYHRREAPFQAWLFMIARNLLNDHYRRSRVRNDLQLEDVVEGQTMGNIARPVEHSLDSVVLQEALKLLPDDQRDVIVMRFITGMSIAEAAQSLNRSEDAVKGLQRRALLSLRGVLNEGKVQYA